jgi:hypothetical protein
MCNVLNRTTLQYLVSVNTPDYPDTEWIIDPDMSAVIDNPVKYWQVVGDIVSMRSNFCKYSFEINLDTYTGKVDVPSLKAEISSLALAAALDEIYFFGMRMDLWFPAELSSSDQIKLTNKIAAHKGETTGVDINLKNASATISSQAKGFQDLTGHNVVRFGDQCYDIQHGETNIFCEKFASVMYIQGGGIEIPDFVYDSAGNETKLKPAKGDWCAFDLVDIDAVTPYGRKATISKIARASNVATITTAATHNLMAGMKVCVNADDDSFDDMEVAVASVPDSTHLTYANAGDDVAEKDAAGTAGMIAVLAPFVPKDMAFPKKEWNISEKDAKSIPPGVYLRFRYVSTGSSDLSIYVHYNLRT